MVIQICSNSRRLKFLDNLLGYEGVSTLECSACASARSTMHRPKFSFQTKVTYPLEILHFDLCGPFRGVAYDKSKYFLVIVDDYSRYVHAEALVSKSDAVECIKEFVNKSFAKFRGRNYPVAFRCDSGGEFVNQNLKMYMMDKGIEFQTSVPGSSHQNGTAERKIRDFQTKIRTLLIDGRVPSVLWPEALRMAEYILNWTPSSAIGFQRPIDVWNGKQMMFQALPIFGTLAHVHIPDRYSQKTDLWAKALPCCYLGPAPFRCAGRFYSHHAKTVFESDQAEFVASKFYFDDYYLEFVNVFARSLNIRMTGGHGLTSVNYSQPQDSKREYELMFQLENDPSAVSIESNSSPEQSPRSTLQADIETEASPRPRELISQSKQSVSIQPSDEVPIIPESNPTEGCLSESVQEVPEVIVEEPTLENVAEEVGDDSTSQPVDPVQDVLETTEESCESGESKVLEAPTPVTDPLDSKDVAVTVAESTVATEVETVQPTDENHGRRSRSAKTKAQKRWNQDLLPQLQPRRYKRKPDVEDYDPDHVVKAPRVYFLRKIAKSGGIYLLKDKPDVEERKDLTPPKLGESLVVGNVDNLQDSEIDWEETLLRHGAAATEVIPRSYKECMKLPARLKWREACDKEMDALDRNSTYKLVDLPEGRSAIGCQWVFTVKDSGLFKARLVALGNYQKKGVDYLTTFSPVIRYTSLRLVLAIAAKESLVVRQWDVSNAFVKAPLKEEIYMKQPEGYVVPGKEKQVWKLEKSFYGLKQAPQAWHELVEKVIMSFGFKRSSAEPCLYYKFVAGKLVMVALYVDDMLVFGPNENEIKKVQTRLFGRFEMKDLGVPEKFLGMNLKVTANSIEISLESYIDKMLAEFPDEDFRSAKIPARLKDGLHVKQDDDVLCDESDYRSLIGKFIYAMNIARPDVAYATLHLSRFLKEPTERHYSAVIMVLRYLKTTKHYSIKYTPKEDDLVGYSDSDFAMGPDRKSRTGVVFLYAGAPVMWTSKMQSTTATSSTVAEYFALYEATREALWIRKLFKELKIKQKNKKTQLWCDNQATIRCANTIGFHEGIKHIDVKYLLVQELVVDESVRVDYIPTLQNIADMFTKALDYTKHKRLVELSGMNVYDEGEC